MILLHYTQNRQPRIMCEWPKKITIGLGKERKDAALKMDVEALPNFSALNVMLNCILSVLKVFILNKRLDFLQIHGVVY